MQKFIPFEDDWDALEKICAEALVPYRIELLGARASAGQRMVFTGSAEPEPQRGTCLRRLGPGCNSDG